MYHVSFTETLMQGFLIPGIHPVPPVGLPYASHYNPATQSSNEWEGQGWGSGADIVLGQVT